MTKKNNTKEEIQKVNELDYISLIPVYIEELEKMKNLISDVLLSYSKGKNGIKKSQDARLLSLKLEHLGFKFRKLSVKYLLNKQKSENHVRDTSK